MKVGEEESCLPHPDSSRSSRSESSKRRKRSMLSGTKCCLLVIVFLTAVVTVSVIVGITDSVHTIDEGNVGIYYVQVGARSGTIITGPPSLPS